MSLADRNNWQLVIANNKTAFRKPDSTLYFQPIRHKIQYSELLSITCDNTKAKSSWVFAGRCYVGNDLGYLFDDALLLKKTKLIQIPEILKNQSISIELIPADWHTLFYYKIEKYIGNPLINLSSDIAEIKAILKNENTP